MQITKMAIRYSRTVNLGNYESCQVACEFEAELDPGDDAQVAKAELVEQVKGSVREQLQPLAKLRLEQVKEVAAGLPAELKAQLSGRGTVDYRLPDVPAIDPNQ